MSEEQKRTLSDLEAELRHRAMMPTFIMEELEQVYQAMKSNKPNDRSEQDRCWAIAITDVQKLVAFFKVYVVKSNE